MTSTTLAENDRDGNEGTYTARFRFDMTEPPN